MLNPDFEANSAQFLMEIGRRPTAEHPPGQLEHVEGKIAIAQDYLARGQTTTFAYNVPKFPFPETRLVRVTQPVVDAMVNVARHLRRNVK